MAKNIEYEFYNGDFSTEVDRDKKSVTMYERGGWSRSYPLTFQELVKYAKQWDVSLDLNSEDKTVAEIATKIILANHAVEHGLDPFQYVNKSDKITDPREIKTIEKFESLLKKYGAEKVLDIMKDNSKENLKNSFNKK